MQHLSQRNADFLAAVNRRIAAQTARGERPNIRKIVSETASSPAPSFYADLDLAEEKINGLLQCPGRSGAGTRSRNEMWGELLSRLIRNGGIRNGRVYRPMLAWILNHGTAPQFYISDTHGLRVYYNTLKSIN